MRKRPSLALMQEQCDHFNQKHSPGDTILCWIGRRDEELVKRTIRAPGAIVLGGHTPVVYVSDGGGCIALSNVEGV